MNVLVLDDDPSLAELIAVIVRRLGHAAVSMNDPIETVTRFGTIATPIDVLMTDMMMPHLDGVDVCKHFAAVAPHVRRIMLTAAPANDEIRDAVTKGIVQILLTKPPSMDDLKHALGS